MDLTHCLCIGYTWSLEIPFTLWGWHPRDHPSRRSPIQEITHPRDHPSKRSPKIQVVKAKAATANQSTHTVRASPNTVTAFPCIDLELEHTLYPGTLSTLYTFSTLYTLHTWSPLTLTVGLVSSGRYFFQNALRSWWMGSKWRK
jgi:hypothetical protein